MFNLRLLIENRIIEIPHNLRRTTLDGCGGVGVSTGDCGSPSPGSIPGHGPIVLIKLIFIYRMTHTVYFSL